MLLVIAIAIGIPMAAVFDGIILLVGIGESELPLAADRYAILTSIMSSPVYLATPLAQSVGEVMIVATWAAALSRFYRAVAGDPTTPLVF